MFVAFLFDKTDGFYAREYGEPSPFGRRVDSFIDIFTYLVTAALLYHVAIAPNIAASVVVVVCLGGLRLLRHDAERFESAGGTSYYRGTTVVHTNVVVVLNYLLATLVTAWSWPPATALILLMTPLMISEYRAPKTVRAHVILGAFAAVVGVCLLLATGLV
jgi:Phosphatidylserine synthase